MVLFGGKKMILKNIIIKVKKTLCFLKKSAQFDDSLSNTSFSDNVFQILQKPSFREKSLNAEVKDVPIDDCTSSSWFESENLCNKNLSLPEENINIPSFNNKKLSNLLIEETFQKLPTDLLLFFQDRFEEIDETLEENQWINKAVDLLDEIQKMNFYYTEGHLPAVDLLKNLLYSELEQLEVAIINKDEWSPLEQKAISVKRDSAIETTIITRKVSSGIMKAGKILRKQEVFLSIPQKGN